PPPEVSPPPPAPPPPVPPPPPPPPAPPPPPVAVAALAWGRWAAQPAGSSDFSLTRDEAKTGRTYVTGNTQYTLYRSESGGSVLTPGLGAYSFSLNQGYAQYNSKGLVTAAAVQGGQLSIDFAARRFATQLNLTSVPTGAVTISGSGAVGRDGTFSDFAVSGQSIQGASAFDGKSAAYLFQKAIGGGTLSGITLWSRP
ncbi:MAG: hypothetical protein JWQ07_1750, partial [Ramlibacter sp.]|nr:hypothetical protein [Ramlibacter sp.]